MFARLYRQKHLRGEGESGKPSFLSTPISIADSDKGA